MNFDDCFKVDSKVLTKEDHPNYGVKKGDVGVIKKLHRHEGNGKMYARVEFTWEGTSRRSVLYIYLENLEPCVSFIIDREILIDIAHIVIGNDEVLWKELVG